MCGRVLGDVADVEDASQATFLVLARAAGSIRDRGALGAWLHGVAFRAANQLRRRQEHRRAAPLTDLAAPAGADDASWREVRGILDEELAQMAEHLRAPLVLCYLQGLTRDEAARALAW